MWCLHVNCIFYVYFLINNYYTLIHCSFIWRGYRSPFNYDRLNDLNNNDKSRVVSPKFQSEWEKQLKKDKYVIHNLLFFGNQKLFLKGVSAALLLPAATYRSSYTDNVISP